MDMLQYHNSIRGRIGSQQAAGHGLSVDLEPDITCHAHVFADCATREAMETAQRPCINGPVDDTAASPPQKVGPNTGCHPVLRPRPNCRWRLTGRRLSTRSDYQYKPSSGLRTIMQCQPSARHLHCDWSILLFTLVTTEVLSTYLLLCFRKWPSLASFPPLLEFLDPIAQNFTPSTPPQKLLLAPQKPRRPLNTSLRHNPPTAQA
jgi:hypothetical protein